MDVWQRWLHHPERLWLHRLFFQIHYAAGPGIGLYVLVLSISGSIIVYRNELPPTFTVPRPGILLDSSLGTFEIENVL